MRQVFVDSRDRTSGTSSDFSIALPQTLALESGHTARIDDLRIPVSQPTISALNNTMQVLVGSQYYNLTLPIGQVNSGPELANLVRQALVASGGPPGSWTVDYNTGQMTMNVTCSNPYTFTGVPSSSSFWPARISRPQTPTSSCMSLCRAWTSAISVAPTSPTWIRSVQRGLPTASARFP